MKKFALLLAILMLPVFLTAKDDIRTTAGKIIINHSIADTSEISALPLDSIGRFISFNFCSAAGDYPKVSVNKSDKGFALTLAGRFRGLDLYNLKIYETYSDFKQLIEIDIPNAENISSDIPKESVFDYNGLNIINPGHLPSLQQITFAKTESKKINKVKFLRYSAGEKFIRITTTDDGIAKIPLKTVLDFLPDLAGKSLSGLHLNYKNSEEKFYSDSPDGFINADANIYFVSRHAFGDTTFFNYYNSDAVYFLSYNADSPGAMYSLPASTVAASDTLKSVNMTVHLEKDSLYAYGFGTDVQNSETVSGEGWYHFPLTPLKDSVVTIRANLFPANDSDLLVRTTFFETYINNKLPYNHNIKHYINRIYSDSLNTPYKEDSYNEEMKKFIPTASFVDGINTFTYKSLGHREYGDSALIGDGLGLDFLEISGNFLPVAENGFCSFSTDTLSSNSQVTIYPFSADNVLILDTINGLKLDGSVQKGFALTVNTSNKSDFSDFAINGKTVAADSSAGFHMLAVSVQNLNYKLSNYSESDLAGFISDIKKNRAGNILAFAINSAALTASDRETLARIGINVTLPYETSATAGIFFAGAASAISSSSKNIAHEMQFIPNSAGTVFACSVNLPAGKRYGILASENSAFQSAKCDSASFTELKQESAPNVLVIAPEIFRKEAEKYILYRSGTHKNLTFGITSVEDIYNEFGSGFVSPQSIKSYLKYLYDLPKSALQIAVIIGDGTNDVRKILSTTKLTNYIPSYGTPVSDSWYSWLDDPTPIHGKDSTGKDIITGYKQDLFSDILLSRIPIASSEDMDNYLAKIKDYDNSANAPWKNSFLFLTGGYNSSEIQTFRNYYTGSLERLFAQSSMCYSDEFINKSQDGSTISTDGIYVLNSLNKGKIFTSFIGHGSPVLLDLDGWTPENLANTGKYGIFYTESCNTGNFALDEQQTRFERYLFAKDRGFVMTIGASTTEDVWAANVAAQAFVTEIASNNARNLTSAYITAKMNAYTTYDVAPEYNRLFSKLQYYGTVLGDPLLELPIDTTPEFYILPEEYTVTNSAGSSGITEDDENAIVKCKIRNLGLRADGVVNIMLIDKYGNSVDTIRTNVPACCPDGDFTYKLPITGHTGLHLLTAIIDPDSLIYERRKDNNRLTLQFEVLQNALLPVEPAAYNNINPVNPFFRMISPFNTSDTVSYYMNIIQEESGDIVKSSTDAELKIENNVIDWHPSINLSKNKNYILRAGYLFSSGYTPANISEIHFHTSGEIIRNLAEYKRTAKNLESAKSVNLSYNSSNHSLEYKIDTAAYKLIGINGGTFDSVTVNRGAFLILNGEYVLTEPRETIGFHIVQFDKNFENMRHKYFATWGTHVDWESETDSVSIQMVKYLRDSIKTDDNIFIASMGEAFRLFSLHNQWHTSGSWDTLKTVLDGFGAKLTYNIDTMYKKNNAWGISYCAAFHINPNAPYVNEGLSLIGDSAVAEGGMIKYYDNASIEYEIQNADSLIGLSLAGSNLLNTNKIKTTISAKSATDVVWNKIFESDTMPIILPAYSNNYSAYSIKHEISKTGNEPSSIDVSGIEASYVPAAEAGLYMLEAPKSGLLAGEPDTVKFKFRNLSVRRRIDSASCELKITDGTNRVDSAAAGFASIAPDSVLSVKFPLSSDYYPAAISISGAITSLSGNEIYDFNNYTSASQSFIPDTVKPVIHFEADNYEVHTGDKIRIQPAFRAYFTDNSPKIITSAEHLRVRINTRYAADNNTHNYLFTAYPKGNDIKADLTFTPDSLDFDENILRVYAEDANGNRDTAYYSLWVSRKGSISDLTIYPNPLEVSSTIAFDYMAPALGGYSLVEIFTYTGQLVNSYKMDLHIGHNEIPIFITDKRGAPLPNGVYFYRISVGGTEVAIDPITDKFVVSK